MRVGSRWLLSVCLVMLVGMPACSNGGSETHAPAGWTSHEDARGFSIQFPKDWKLLAQNGSGSVEVDGPNAAAAVVWPFFLRVSLDQNGAAAILAQLGAKLRPAAGWIQPSPAGPGAVRMTGDAGESRFVAVLGWVASQSGTAGAVYLSTAAASAYQGLESTFAGILQSFRLRGQAVRSSPAPRFVRWVDPREQAFSVEVPAGYRAAGGTFRTGLLVQGQVTATSPDGNITLFMGNHFPLYTQPNENIGLYEGQSYAFGGYASPILHYSPGAEYFATYLLPQLAPQAEITAERDRPDIAGFLAQFGGNRYSAGEVQYRYQDEGRTLSGGAICITDYFASGDRSFVQWEVTMLLAFDGPIGTEAAGAVAAAHMASSFQVNPQWQAGDLAAASQQSRIISEMGQAVSSSSNGGYWSRQAIGDQISQRRSEATLDVETVADPATGSQFQVESSPNYYWIDERGDIVGTDVDIRPSLDFRELLTVSG